MQRQTVHKKGDNVVIPFPAVDKGHTDPRNIGVRPIIRRSDSPTVR
jgi:hypothetical protein